MKEYRRKWVKRPIVNKTIYCIRTKTYHYIRLGVVEKHRGRSGGMMYRLVGGRLKKALRDIEVAQSRRAQAHTDTVTFDHNVVATIPPNKPEATAPELRLVG